MEGQIVTTLRRGFGLPGAWLRQWWRCLAIATVVGAAPAACFPTDVCGCSPAFSEMVVYGRITSARGPVSDAHVQVQAGDESVVETRSGSGGHYRLRLSVVVESTEVAVVVTPPRRSGLGEEAAPLDIAGGFNTSAVELNFRLAPLTR